MLARAGLRPQSMADLDHWQLFALVLLTLAYLFGLTLSAVYYRAALRNIELADVAIGDATACAAMCRCSTTRRRDRQPAADRRHASAGARPWMRVRTTAIPKPRPRSVSPARPALAMAGITAASRRFGRRGSTLGEMPPAITFDWDLSPWKVKPEPAHRRLPLPDRQRRRQAAELHVSAGLMRLEPGGRALGGHWRGLRVPERLGRAPRVLSRLGDGGGGFQDRRQRRRRCLANSACGRVVGGRLHALEGRWTIAWLALAGLGFSIFAGSVWGILSFAARVAP